MSPKKLQGGEPFDSLMKKLAKIPKVEADKAARVWKKKRTKKKRKPDGHDEASK